MNYKEVYRRFFGFCVNEYVPSEISGGVAVDIHHITPRSQGGKDNIENLMAVTRGEHRLIHDVGHYTKEFLVKKHKEFIQKMKPEYEWQDGKVDKSK